MEHLWNKDGKNGYNSVVKTVEKESDININDHNPGDLMMVMIKNIPEMKIRYHREKFPTLPDVVQYGNFIDLYNAEAKILKAGEFAYLNLGVSVECPEGYWMQIVPRSSTFKKYGIIQTNSFGVIDTEYCGDDDIVMMPVYATRDIIIPANERICQFRLEEDIKFSIKPVDKLENENRGGLGHTGRK